MFKEIINEILFIDFGEEPDYSSDQVYDAYPCRFATVSFKLMCSDFLIRIVDRIRTQKDKELKPMYPFDEYTEDMCDEDGWYDFFITINSYSETKLCSAIEVIVDSTDAKDADELYYIPLDEHEQKQVYQHLDKQCKQYLNKSCDELLQEAERLTKDE